MRAAALTAACVLMAVPAPVLAGNGTKLIALGSEAVSMGGADVAVARDAMALNANPAGLTQIAGQRLDLYGAVAFARDVGHADQFGNDVHVANKNIAGLTGAYAERWADSPVWVGMGLFAVGGVGVEYHALNTAFGTVDELTSLFGVLRLDLGAAVRISDSISAGASVGLSHSRIRQEVFPDTSVAAAPFFGYELKDTDGTALGSKVGLMIRPRPRHSIGITYAARVNSPMKGGRFISNQTDIGLGRVTYRDARVDGLNLPEEVQVGYAVQATPRWLLAADVAWINWSEAVGVSTLTAANPDDAGAAPVIVLPTDNGWKDQYVVALGMAFSPSPAQTVYAGYNHGNKPIPDDHLNPLLAAISEDTVTAGYSRALGGKWRAYGGVEYSVGTKVTYTNPDLPLGTNARESSEYVTLNLTLARAW